MSSQLSQRGKLDEFARHGIDEVDAPRAILETAPYCPRCRSVHGRAQESTSTRWVGQIGVPLRPAQEAQQMRDSPIRFTLSCPLNDVLGTEACRTPSGAGPLCRQRQNYSRAKGDIRSSPGSRDDERGHQRPEPEVLTEG